MNMPFLRADAAPPCALTPGPFRALYLAEETRADTADGRQQREDIRSQCRALCQACPWLTPCGEHAITTGEIGGIWGALSYAQRRDIRERRARERRAAMAVAS